MTTKNGQLLYKALLQLDYGKTEAGEKTLRNMIRFEVTSFDDKINQVKALCCLGEILFEKGEVDEAKLYFEKILTINIDNDHFDQDLISTEKKLAQTLLKKIG